MAENLGALVAKLQADVSDLKKGLRESREDLKSFGAMAKDIGSKVKQALQFAGVAIGIYEIASALKNFAKESAMVGASTETLAVGMEHIGKNAGLSRGTLDYYVGQLKNLGITTKEAMEAVTRFVVSGLPLDKIEQLADVARNQAFLVGKNTSEAFNDILTGILTNQPEVLRKYLLNIGLLSTVLKSAMKTGMTAEDIDPLTRSMLMLNAVLETGKRSAGAYEAGMTTVGKQLTSLPRHAEEAKVALWALFQPVMIAAVQEMTQVWKDLKTWADANQASLKRWGQEGAAWLKWLAIGIRDIGAFIAENKNLIKIFIEMTVALYGLYGAWNAIQRLRQQAGFTPKPGAVGEAIQEGQARDRTREGKELDVAGTEATVEAQRRGISTEKYLELAKEEQRRIIEGQYKKYTAPSVLPAVLPEHETPAERAERESRAAHDKALADAQKALDKDKKGGGGGGGKESIDSLLAPMLAMYKAKREAELQDAQNSLELLKSTNDKKRAELAKSLAEEEIDGQTYYQRLQDLQQQETDAALAMIEKKKEAQAKAYQESLTEIEADPKMSDEAKSIARQKMAAENQKTLSQLTLGASQAKLDGEVKVTNELKRQVEVRKQYEQKTEDLNLETAFLLGKISDQEAILQRLALEWQRNKQTALDAGGASPEHLRALEQKYQAEVMDVNYGDQIRRVSGEISGGFRDMVNGLVQGGYNFREGMRGFVANLQNAILEPGFKAIEDSLVKVLKSLLNAAMSALSSAGEGGGGWGSLFKLIGSGLGALGGGETGGGDTGGGDTGGGGTALALALAGEQGPKIVSPLDKWREMSKSLSSALGSGLSALFSGGDSGEIGGDNLASMFNAFRWPIPMLAEGGLVTGEQEPEIMSPLDKWREMSESKGKDPGGNITLVNVLDVNLLRQVSMSSMVSGEGREIILNTVSSDLLERGYVQKTMKRSR